MVGERWWGWGLKLGPAGERGGLVCAGGMSILSLLSHHSLSRYILQQISFSFPPSFCLSPLFSLLALFFSVSHAFFFFLPPKNPLSLSLPPLVCPLRSLSFIVWHFWPRSHSDFLSLHHSLSLVTLPCLSLPQCEAFSPSLKPHLSFGGH